MKIALYGMPCAGKSTLMKGIKNARIINGSQELNRISGGCFSELSEEEKQSIRVKYTEFIDSLQDETIISDGHYAFMENIVFTKEDGDVYDVFMYLYCSPEILKRRYELSTKNARFKAETIEMINKWQQFEIQSLREEAHRRNKDFYVISDYKDNYSSFYSFLKKVQGGFSSFELAKKISQDIMKHYIGYKELYIVDGDKTIINEDSYRVCYNQVTKVFEGDFYTGYQSFLFEIEVTGCLMNEKSIEDIHLNHDIFKIICKRNYIILSSGIQNLWSKIVREKNLERVYASPYVSADTKYFVVKLLRERGYKVNAYGDSKIDLYMLKEADKGTLYIGSNLSKSLKNESLRGLNIIYNHSLVILEDEDLGIKEDIQICKSSSGINGNKLAAAHMRLGKKLGKRISRIFTAQDTAILVLERGGRFFGDGIYMAIGGTFYTVNPKRDNMPKIDAERVIIVDSVINTGNSILNIIQHLKSDNPNIDIIIATNVIQKQVVELFSHYLVFTIRVSENSFVGRNQVRQIGKSGPDTADRLFNLIKRRF